MRSGIAGNTVSVLTAQSTFLNNFEDIVNCRVNIQEDIKHYQDTLSYASSKVDYSVGENIYMLPSDMNLKIETGTVGYNNKILVSDEKFSLGKIRLTLFSMGYFKNTTVWGAIMAPIVTSLFLKVEGQNLGTWDILMCLLQKWH